VSSCLSLPQPYCRYKAGALLTTIIVEKTWF
jgi:hypothetical protein